MDRIPDLPPVELFRKQFILTAIDADNELSWPVLVVGNYKLYYHPSLEVTIAGSSDKKLILLGSVFDWRYPLLDNQLILDKVHDEIKDSSSLFSHFFDFTGQYVLIYKSENEFIVLNDACAQKEIYYDDTFSVFGSQPKLIGKVITLVDHTDKQEREFYESKTFLANKVYVGDKTQYLNLRHLRPNYFIDVNSKRVDRFFPYSNLPINDIDEVVAGASEILKGYIESISHRNPVVMGVTGGHDSRVLFLSSLNSEMKYYITRFGNDPDSVKDVRIAHQLVNSHDRSLDIISTIGQLTLDPESAYVKSLDYPRTRPVAERYFPGLIYLNGNISEIARSYYGYLAKPDCRTLAFLIGYKNDRIVELEFREWLKNNANYFVKRGYHVLDMFYWEERMGNWAAKGKTESTALGIDVLSPFCSRVLLTLLLSTDRNLRKYHKNILYCQLIRILSDKAGDIPFHDAERPFLIKLVIKSGLFEKLQSVGMKYRKFRI